MPTAQYQGPPTELKSGALTTPNYGGYKTIGFEPDTAQQEVSPAHVPYYSPMTHCPHRHWDPYQHSLISPGDQCRG